VLAISLFEAKFPSLRYIEAHGAFLHDLADEVGALGATLLIVADVPAMRVHHGGRLDYVMARSDAVAFNNNDRLLSRTYDPPGDYNITHARQLHAGMDAMHAELAATHDAVEYIPSEWMYDKLCTESTCGALVPGSNRTFIYSDRHHMTTAGSLYLGPFINCWLWDHGLLGAPSAPAPLGPPSGPPLAYPGCSEIDLQGDFNGNGRASLGDALTIAAGRLDFGLTGVNPITCLGGDLDGDGLFTINDAGFAAQVAFGNQRFPWDIVDADEDLRPEV